METTKKQRRDFDEGTEERRIFYIDGNAPLGRSLTAKRYDLVWGRAEVKFKYLDGVIIVDDLAALSMSGTKE